MDRVPRRGEIWTIDWSPSRGSEQAGIRPAIIIQTDAANTNPRYPNTIVLAISTKGRSVPFHIALDPTLQNGLKEPSFIKCEQILTVSKDRLAKKLGAVTESALEAINQAVLLVLAIR